MGRLHRLSLAALVSACALTAPAPSALGATAPGPAWVDELGSQLQPIRDDGRGDVAAARDSGLTVQRGEVEVDVYVSGDPDAAVDRLEAAGMSVVVTAEKPRSVVEGSVPLDAIDGVARLGVSDAVLPVVGYGIDASGGTDVGAITSLGVTRHNLPAAIAAAGTSGAGVDVGVISDSIDQVNGGISDSQATGDLPANTQTLLDSPTGDDEGRAMAEIIYDEAPGLNRILFSSGTATGPVGKAASIDNLTANGVDVIADDIFYLSEPFFQDGVVAKAADRARAAGVAYFASAGNRGRQSYESTFRNAAGLHDFDPGAGTDTRNCFSGSVPTGGLIQVALGWDEPVGGVTTDLDLRLTTSAGTTLANAASNSITNGNPKEVATFTNGGLPIQPCVEITRFAGTGTPLMKWIEFDNYSGTPVPEFDTQSDTINPDAASAQGTLAVAAVAQGDAGLNTPESFSSRGYKTRLFDPSGNRLASPLVLFKPQLAAADGVNTTVPGFNPFFGTSAATPSAAGIATILRATNPNASVNEIYAQMTDPANAIDCTNTSLVPDPDCGAGFILADRAVAGLDRTGAVVKAALVPAQPNGKGGWFTKDVKLNWSITDPESPIEGTSGCGSATVTTDGTRTFSCSATSGGGPATGSVTVKRDTKKPKKPKIRGIKKGKAYRANQLPAKKKVKKCKSKDATSGLKSCKVRGYSAKPGKHRLKATATDRAGLKSKKSLKYRVR